MTRRGTAFWQLEPGMLDALDRSVPSPPPTPARLKDRPMPPPPDYKLSEGGPFFAQQLNEALVLLHGLVDLLGFVREETGDGGLFRERGEKYFGFVKGR